MPSFCLGKYVLSFCSAKTSCAGFILGEEPLFGDGLVIGRTAGDVIDSLALSVDVPFDRLAVWPGAAIVDMCCWCLS